MNYFRSACHPSSASGRSYRRSSRWAEKAQKKQKLADEEKERQLSFLRALGSNLVNTSNWDNNVPSVPPPPLPEDDKAKQCGCVVEAMDQSFDNLHR
eukprot:scaffold10537_cov69-Cylindrotheca_fusiformis.AAC.3